MTAESGTNKPRYTPLEAATLMANLIKRRHRIDITPQQMLDICDFDGANGELSYLYHYAAGHQRPNAEIQRERLPQAQITGTVDCP